MGYGRLSGNLFGSLQFFVEAGVQVVDIQPGQDAAGNVMPAAEDGTGNGGGSEGSEVGFGQSGSQAEVQWKLPRS